MPPPLNPTKRQAILDDIEATAGTLDGTVRKIADRQGVSTATVQRLAKAADLSDAWSRDKTQKGTQARQADLAELRSLTSARFLQEANKMLDRLNEPCEVFAFGGAENRFNSEVLHRPPSQEARNFLTSAAVALDKHLLLDKHDTDDQSGAAVDSWLRSVMGRDQTPMG